MINPVSSLGSSAWDQIGAVDLSAIRQQKEAQAFQAMDTNGDGSVSESEFATWLQQMESQTPQTGDASNMPSASDLFAQLDTNGDGVLTPDEMSNLPQVMRTVRETQTFNAMDTNGDGSVSKDEFATWLQQMQSQMAQTGNAADMPSADALFAQLDTNGDGVLSADELSNLPQVMGQALSEAQTFSAMDTNGDGSISQDEFTNWLQQMQAQTPQLSSLANMPSADQIFSQLDTNGDGVLTPDELSGVHQKMQAIKEAQLFQAMDTNGDGSVSQAEFANWLASVQSPQTATGSQTGTASTGDLFTQLTQDVGATVNGLLNVLQQGSQSAMSQVGTQAAAGSAGTMSIEDLLASYLYVSAALKQYGEAEPGSILNTAA